MNIITSIRVHFKSIIFVSIFLAICTSSVNAQQERPQAAFEQANRQLQEGQIRQALQSYTKLEEQKQLSGALFLNMGISYIRLDSMGKAKFYFLKAQQFDETSERALQGLEYVENRFSRQSAVLPTLPWQEALNWLEAVAGGTLLLAIGLILLNLGVFLYILGWFKKYKRSFIPTAAIGIASAGLLIILLGFYVDYRADRYHKAVMVSQESTVREQPAADGAVVSQAFEGYTFNIDRHKSEQYPAWTYIQMSNGQYGWIPSKEIMIL